MVLRGMWWNWKEWEPLAEYVEYQNERDAEELRLTVLILSL